MDFEFAFPHIAQATRSLTLASARWGEGGGDAYRLLCRRTSGSMFVLDRFWFCMRYRSSSMWRTGFVQLWITIYSMKYVSSELSRGWSEIYLAYAIVAKGC